MSENLPPNAEIARYWLETLQRIMPDDNDATRAAHLLLLNRQILSAHCDPAAEAAPGESLFDVVPTQFDQLLSADRT